MTTDRGWVEAGDLRAGEPIATVNGTTGTVVWVHTVPGQSNMYNLTVVHDHTYAVGDGRWVVHNCGGDIYTSPQQYAHERAQELQSAIPESSQGRVTMGVGVLRGAAGRRFVVIATSEPNGYLREAVDALIRPDEVPISGRYDAEQNIVDFAERDGYKVIAVGAGRPICLDCQGAIVDAGGWEAIASFTKSHFLPFWMRAGAP